MKLEQLEELKKISNENYNKIQNRIKEEENSKEVKEYLKNLENLEKAEKYKEFLKKLEIGDDGTIFEPYTEILDKSTSKYHYGLIEVLRHIEYLKYLNYKKINNKNITLEEYNEKCNDNTEISFHQITQYIQNAKKVLNNMNLYEEDRIIENEYGIKIYENPKKYSIINFKEVTKLIVIKKCISEILMNENLKNNYKSNEFIINKKEDEYIFKVKQEKSITPIYTHKLTSREFEAFYGTDAQNTLSIIPVELNNKECSLEKNKMYIYKN